jgi:hypothetical protein
MGFALLSVLCILLPHSVFPAILGGNVSNAAHLGGMAMGFFFVRFILQGNWPRRAGNLRSLRRSEPPTAPRAPRLLVEKEFVEKSVADEVDPILDKISAHGIQSLTAREREVLENARKKMTRS